jgi:hypothetical protein
LFVQSATGGTGQNNSGFGQENHPKNFRVTYLKHNKKLKSIPAIYNGFLFGHIELAYLGDGSRFFKRTHASDGGLPGRLWA